MTRKHYRLDRIEAAIQPDQAAPWPVEWDMIDHWQRNVRIIDFDRFVVWAAGLVEDDFIEWIPNEALDKSPGYRIRGGYHAKLTGKHRNVGDWGGGELWAACTGLNWMIGTVQDSADVGDDWALTWLPLPTNTEDLLNTLKSIPDSG